jgi:class 3 adenylate cyclase/pimeloyl-ACP methyl ester carboxylesterase
MAERRMATILAIDVVGYSRMMHSDPAGVLAALNNIFGKLVKPSVANNNGRVVKLLGDGALIEFQSSYHAISCAAAIQEGMRGPNAPHSYTELIFLRMGLHAGDVLVEGEDIFGDGVNIAARLEAEAEAGGILLSRTVADLAGSDLPYRLRHEGTHSFKNIANPIETLSVDLSDKEVAAARTKMAKSQEVRFCKTKDNLRLAWATAGSGPPIVKAQNWISHIELDWRDPSTAHIFESLAARYRLVFFDARGNGLSDWEMENISFELMVDDLECVFDAAGVDRAPIISMSQGCAVAAAFAAKNPDRVSAIVMIGAYPVGRAKRKSKKDQERAKALRAMMTASWDDEHPSLRDLMAEIIVPGASAEDRRRYADDMRDMISPENLGKYREALDNFDITELLPQVNVPCLVLHCRGDRLQPIEQGRKMAAGLPDARFIAYDSNNHKPTENDPCWPLIEREIHAFLEANT